MYELIYMDTYEHKDDNVHTHICSAYERKRGICLLCLAYFTWCNYLRFHPFCLQMAQLLSSLPLDKIPLCTYTTFISAAGHLERFYILVTVNTAAISMGVFPLMLLKQCAIWYCDFYFCIFLLITWWHNPSKTGTLKGFCVSTEWWFLQRAL